MLERFFRPGTAYASLVVLAFSAVAAQAQTTSLYLQSQSGEFVGAGATQTVGAGDATFGVSATSAAIFATVVKPDGTSWNIDLFAPMGSVIAAGTYINATRFPTAAWPALDVYGDGRGCESLTGRFLIRELDIDGGGAVVRFAADFEQHCEDASPGLFGALRFNSTVASLSPFDGAYPDYRITVVPSSHGVVTGGGLSCGPSQTTCTKSFTFSQSITLTATAASGYRFSEWAGACVTTPLVSSVTVNVNAPKQCEALFVASSEPPLTTALYLESQPGDPVGGGATTTITSFDAAFSFSLSGSRLTATIAPPSFSPFWFVSLELPSEPGLVPGTYLNAVGTASGIRPAISIRGSQGSCNTSTGRFVVREFLQGPFGRVVRLAIDFEQHCNDGSPALFGALRYNSTISSLSPFDGAYPDYRLIVTQPAHGTITGDGISCGAGGGTCIRTLSSPAGITLTATPDAGYAFAGWGGGCFGGPSVSVFVNQPKQCEAFFESLTSPSAHSSLFIDSRSGDPVGQGLQWFYMPGNSRWSAFPINTFDGRGVNITIDGATRWSLDFDADGRRELTPGTYLGAIRYSQNGQGAGLSVNGSSCSTVTGRFVVHEVEFGAAGSIVRFAADFEQHCDDRDAGLYGSIRFNSTIPSAPPFGGAYPDYRLTIVRPDRGTVSGPGIACSASQATCVTTLAAPASLTLTAAPDVGFVFVGWTGACSGTSTTAVRVNQPLRCEALFDSAVSPSRTVLYMRSDPGDTVGLGQEWLYSAGAAWNVTLIEFGTRRGVRVAVADATPWSLDFYAGVNATIAPGTFLGVPRYSFGSSGPGMHVSRSSACNTLLGRFVVREIVFAGDGSIARFAADFEQHCNGADAALIGAVRYNSTVSAFAPFDGVYPDYRLTIARASNGVVAGAGLACGTNQVGCVRVSGSPFEVELTASPDPGFMFVGWRGTCRGGSRTTVRVNQPLSCEAMFDSLASPTTRTVLAADSQAGDTMGLGRQWFVGPNDGVWTVSPLDSARRRGVQISIADNPSWTLQFDAGTGNTLVPGTYAPIVRSFFSSSFVPGMSISIGNGFCSQITGRFVVREIEFATDNKVIRFAADFEQHCEGRDPALFGAVRFNSTIPTFTAFDGIYPRYTLTLAPGAHGIVTGGGFDCGPGRGACSQLFSAPTTITLTATPERGYALRGWTGDCSGLRTTSIRVNTISQCAPIFVPVVVPHDLDGDGSGDLTVWRPADGTWYWATSSSGFDDTAARAKTWGSTALGDVPFLADIDGDAIEDLVVWRASSGTWFWLLSSSGYDYAGAGSKQWGASALGDIPMLGDMDGDGRADLVIWRPINGTFYWLTSSSGYSYSFARGVQWGNQNEGDKPMLGDFDGDGLQDLVVWRASTGTWFWLPSSSGYSYPSARSVQWGSAAEGDVVFTGDLDGDARSELIVWRPGSGTWFWLTSANGYGYAQQRMQAWGNAALGDVPAIGDFDGDRSVDLAVWRRSTGTWYWLTSSSGFAPAAARAKQWGSQAAGDVPIVK